jgi:hypothetical protein
MKCCIALFLFIVLDNKSAYNQSYPTTIAVKMWSAHFTDWERGTLSVEGTIKRSLSKKIELSGSVSNVKDNLLLDPDINPENYL